MLVEELKETMFFKVAWLVMRKDMMVELRTRELLYTTLFFAASCVLVFVFGFVHDGRAVSDAVAGILWIAIAFTGTLALGRTFERERYNDVIGALLIAPVDRPAIYLGKLLGIIGLMGLVEIVIVPLVALFFQAPLLSSHFVLNVMLLASGTIGFAAVGTLFAAMLVNTRNRNVLLPVLLYPITIPVIIGGVQGTAALLQPESDPLMAQAWIGMLVFFDAVFITLALWTFEPVMTE